MINLQFRIENLVNQASGNKQKAMICILFDGKEPVCNCAFDFKAMSKKELIAAMQYATNTLIEHYERKRFNHGR